MPRSAPIPYIKINLTVKEAAETHLLLEAVRKTEALPREKVMALQRAEQALKGALEKVGARQSPDKGWEI